MDKDVAISPPFAVSDRPKKLGNSNAVGKLKWVKCLAIFPLSLRLPLLVLLWFRYQNHEIKLVMEVLLVSAASIMVSSPGCHHGYSRREIPSTPCVDEH